MSHSVPSSSMPNPSTSQPFIPPELSLGSSWKKKEKELLKNKWHELKGDWSQIQLHFPKRTIRALKVCWLRLNPHLKENELPAKKNWSKYSIAHFNEHLKQAIKESTDTSRKINWQIVACKIKGKTAYQCQYHYENFLDPTVYKGDWTPEEDKLILEMKNNGSIKMSKIAAILQEKTGFKRTARRIKTRWETLTRNNHTAKRKRFEAKRKIEGLNFDTSKLNPEEQKDPPAKKIKLEEERDAISVSDYNPSASDSSRIPKKEDSPSSLIPLEQQPVAEGDEGLGTIENFQIEENQYEAALDKIIQELFSKEIKLEEEVVSSPAPDQSLLGPDPLEQQPVAEGDEGLKGIEEDYQMMESQTDAMAIDQIFKKIFPGSQRNNEIPSFPRFDQELSEILKKCLPKHEDYKT